MATSRRVAPFTGTTETEGGQVHLQVVRGDESSAVEHLGLQPLAEAWMRATMREAAGNSPGWGRGSQGGAELATRVGTTPMRAPSLAGGQKNLRARVTEEE